MGSVVYYINKMNGSCSVVHVSYADIETIENFMYDPSDSHCLFSFWLGDMHED